MSEKTSERNETAVTHREPFLSEFDPFRRGDPLRSVIDRFFGGFPQDWPNGAPALAAPSVDITETDEEYRIRAELPGVSRSDVTVELENGMLTIRGEKKSQRDEKAEKGRRLECSYGAFSRSFSLPQDANADKISAAFKDGVLDIGIKKNPESKPKQIAVKG